jgi:hypothetical protein
MMNKTTNKREMRQYGAQEKMLKGMVIVVLNRQVKNHDQVRSFFVNRTETSKKREYPVGTRQLERDYTQCRNGMAECEQQERTNFSPAAPCASINKNTSETA